MQLIFYEFMQFLDLIYEHLCFFIINTDAFLGKELFAFLTSLIGLFNAPPSTLFIPFKLNTTKSRVL